MNTVRRGVDWPALAALVGTTFLTSYALDRRHKFRAEFRLLVRKGWEEAQAKQVIVPSAFNPFEAPGAAGEDISPL